MGVERMGVAVRVGPIGPVAGATVVGASVPPVGVMVTLMVVGNAIAETMSVPRASNTSPSVAYSSMSIASPSGVRAPVQKTLVGMAVTTWQEYTLTVVVP